MNNQEGEIRSYNKHDDDCDDHHHDTIMPGFRFHPTEEELIEFYLRRKVEGKRFNVELITFLDLYRYEPWELPALAAIGEKEWYFYVPRERKYRNGDRPNRVTTSGYWKATGADRTIKSEDFWAIGLKKTLVFYSGKAPKGVRTSWIMNEYRLPLHETEKLQKGEISLCRVYKRAGVQDNHFLIPKRRTSSSSNESSTSIFFSESTSHHQSDRASSSISSINNPLADTDDLNKLVMSNNNCVTSSLNNQQYLVYPNNVINVLDLLQPSSPSPQISSWQGAYTDTTWDLSAISESDARKNYTNLFK